MPNDVFCSSSIKAGIFFETENTFAVYNIAPVVPGHSLIIPKRHVEKFEDLSDEELTGMHAISKNILPVLLDLYAEKSNSYNLILQVGPYSGMSITHLHMHVIPRKKGAGSGGNIIEKIEHVGRLAEKDYAAEVARLRKAMSYKQSRG